MRGCRCRFLVRYDHDQSEVLPLLYFPSMTSLSLYIYIYSFTIISSSFRWFRLLVHSIELICEDPRSNGEIVNPKSLWTSLLILFLNLCFRA